MGCPQSWSFVEADGRSPDPLLRYGGAVTYQRIVSATDLPRPGQPTARAREKSDLDFKTFADKRKMFEHAKDVAAFANTLGGVILVGADDQKGTLLTYPGLAGQTFAEVKAVYEDAARLCSPSPVVDVLPIDLPSGGQLAAVNVDPFIDQIVASPTDRDLALGQPRPKETPWIFPVRVGSTTDRLPPEALPMYMNTTVRRVVLLLARIPANDGRHALWSQPDLQMHSMGSPTYKDLKRHEVQKTEVDLERNAAKFFVTQKSYVNIPLTEIETVWIDALGVWNIRVAGRIDERSTAPSYYYFPVVR